MRGRKPQNDAVKRMKGKIIGRINPPADRVLPSPPEHLSPEARVHWGWYSAQLDRMGVLSEEHARGLEQLCCLYQETVELRAAIKVSGRTYTTTNESGAIMIRPHPLVAMLADADRRYRGWESEFGLTPAS